jgi:hypothetical protein
MIIIIIDGNNYRSLKKPATYNQLFRKDIP